MAEDVVIVGAGLAGLNAARQLQAAGRRFLLLDASDAVGGRIRTDLVEGYCLDRGFQVFLNSYPEARQVLDLAKLNLKPFEPGVLVRHGGRLHRLVDPWRRPVAGLLSAFSPIGGLLDKLRVARLRSRVLRGTIEDHFQLPETTTLEALRSAGFSSTMIERFFRPFLGGIFLDRELQTSSRMFEFVFRMFTTGDACLPAEGMEAIPRQLAAGLPSEHIRLNTRVAGIDQGSVRLDTGEVIESRQVIVATESPAASALLGTNQTRTAQGVTCLYFSSERPPINEPMLVLNGEGSGPVNNLCVPSLVAPSYAPPGRHLVSATVLGVDPGDDTALRQSVLGQMRDWFGPQVDGWKPLRIDRIAFALPGQAPPALSPPERPVRVRPGLFVCGDHLDNASINGALVSGRRAALAAMEVF